MPTKQEFQNHLDKAISFDTYFQQFEEKVLQIKKGNTDIPYSEFYLLNLQRLKRSVKQTVLTKELTQTVGQLNQKITWLVISEYWCGDAAQSLGTMKKIVDASNGMIEFKLVFRDETPELINAFLTNGGIAIPKIIQLNDSLDLLADWGPRPAEAQQMVQTILKEGKPYAEELHKWYAKNKTVDLQSELNAFLQKAKL
ncbi:MAG: thioredoxin family protein [Cyclobacteriaceae bacterium]